jgi:glycosyltransferase involved in cell wall biosynthesis
VVPTFSIAVTTFNRPELLRETLLSILAQTFSDFEVLVGNDYTEEPLTTSQLDLEDSRIRIVNHPRNLGEADNMNALLDLSQGRFFTWQCDDDLYAPTFLAEVHSAISSSNHPVSVFTSYGIIHGVSPSGQQAIPSQPVCTYTGRDFLAKYLSGQIKAMGCAGVFPREYLVGLGGVECLAQTNRPLYSEHLLLLLAGLQDQVMHIDTPLVTYRIHDTSWGASTTDLLLYGEACKGLLGRGIAVLSSPGVRVDFRRNLTALLRFVTGEYFGKARAGEGAFSRNRVIPFFFSLRAEFAPLSGTTMHRTALLVWMRTGLVLAVWLCTRFNLRAALSQAFGKEQSS